MITLTLTMFNYSLLQKKLFRQLSATELAEVFFYKNFFIFILWFGQAGQRESKVWHVTLGLLYSDVDKHRVEQSVPVFALFAVDGQRPFSTVHTSRQPFHLAVLTDEADPAFVVS
ncbi:hypothetical protein T05_16402 [Trichinella murrelli]|uniref:Uncharacterized protein n=1 Tax=Trichinella murrelli TaxID=144512 RepID=A0A0V0TPA9_9BILA|nr:hypothetical protein T05_16402 [Trichinella murrelli]